MGGVRHTAKIGNDLDINWGNILTSLNWKRMFSDDLHLDAKLYYTRINTYVGITNEDWEMGVYEYNVSEYQIKILLIFHSFGRYRILSQCPPLL